MRLFQGRVYADGYALVKVYANAGLGVAKKGLIFFLKH